MDEATTKQPDTMRQLLARWAEVEPGRCKEEVDWVYAVHGPSTYLKVYFDPTPSDLEMAWIQWATQQAILARGWFYNLEWDGEWYVWIDDKHTGSDLNNSTKAILEAYLKALEHNQ